MSKFVTYETRKHQVLAFRARYLLDAVTTHNFVNVPGWAILAMNEKVILPSGERTVVITTGRGDVATSDDWIIRHLDGTITSLTDDQFRYTYINPDNPTFLGVTTYPLHVGT